MIDPLSTRVDPRNEPMDARGNPLLASRKTNRRRVIAGGMAGLATGVPAAITEPAMGQTPLPTVTPSSAGFSGNLDIGGRSLFVETRGAGSPTVVFEAGALGRSDVWSRDSHEPAGMRVMVLPAVATFAHVGTYDRPGTIGEVNPDLDPTAPLFYPSRGDPVSQPRTVGDVVNDLHAVLQGAAIPSPYVLVGHSMGGLCMQLYASRYPDDVVGMVLVDATHEDVWARFRQALLPSAWETFEALTVENHELLAAYPEAERLLRAPLVDDPGMAQMRRARIDSPLRPMPLVVLSHGIPFSAPFPEWPTAEMERIMLGLQTELASLVPNARHVIAEQSGHNIHQDQPELVIEAIRQVVGAVRDPDTWSEGPTSRESPAHSSWRVADGG